MRNFVCAGAWRCDADCSGEPAFARGCRKGPAGFPRWLQGFKQEAVAQGISPANDLGGARRLTYDPATIAKDRAQGVFAQTFLQFSDRMVYEQSAAGRTAADQEIRRHLREDRAGIRRAGSGARRLLGAGDGFRQGDGQYGDAPLARHFGYDCRRPEEFRSSSSTRYASSSAAISRLRKCAARRMERSGSSSSAEDLLSNMPSISTATGGATWIRSAPDALASAANYLEGHRLEAGPAVDRGSRVPVHMAWSQADVTIKKPRSYWAQAGVTYRNGKAVPARQCAGRHCCCPWGGTGPPSSPIRISTSISNGTSRSSTRPRRPITRRVLPARRR